MIYVTFTSKHQEGFCLFDTDRTNYNSVETPAGRDLVGELADACRDVGLGLILYYSHGVDWRHPYAPNNDEWGHLDRPDYDEAPKMYAQEEHDLEQYLDHVRGQVADELLDEYVPLQVSGSIPPACLRNSPSSSLRNSFSKTSMTTSVRSSPERSSATGNR